MVFTAVVFFIILSILVLIHELGHFLVARWIGVKVEEFGLGLPPRIIGKKWKGIIWSINWLPIGGFVKLAGEDQEEDQKIKVKGQKLGEYFWARSKKERAAILLAGVTMNFVLALGITTYLLIQGIHEPSGRVHIERVLPQSPAEKSGIQVGDIITIVKYKQEERKIIVPKDLIDVVKAHAGEEVVFVATRGESMYDIPIVLRRDYPSTEGPTGIAVSDLELKTYSVMEAPLKAFIVTIQRARDMLVGIVTTIGKIATLQSVGRDVAGPIGIAQVTGTAVKFGFKAVLEFMSILSLNLAVLNALPIPALDGGRLAFVFLEKIVGRKVRPAFERSAHQIGMIILLFLVLLVSINDIMRLRGGS